MYLNLLSENSYRALNLLNFFFKYARDLLLHVKIYKTGLKKNDFIRKNKIINTKYYLF